MNPICDIVVLTWNQKKIIRTFVDSFLASQAPATRLIIIDNGSKDGTPEYLSSLRDTPSCTFKIVLNTENKGFVGGTNQGIAMSTAPYVCLANNDLVFTKGWLDEIIAVFEHNQEVGVLNPNSNNLGVFCAPQQSLESLALDLKKKHEGVFVEMPFCIGFCFIIRRQVIDAVGGLSEELRPMFFEDTDYSMKAQAAGYRIGVAKGSYVWHDEHASFSQWPKAREEAFVKSRNTFIAKWGNILRIAWVVTTQESISKYLDDALALVRNGNYLWFFVRGSGINEETVFTQRGLVVHSGIRFVRFFTYIDLAWKIFIKKKKYAVVISRCREVRKLLSFFRYPTADGFDRETIKRLKRKKTQEST